MAISGREAVACLKVLVCIAKADGTLHDEERDALECALHGLKVPGAANIENLLEEKGDLDAQLRQLVSPEAREQAYQSACGMACADGNCAPAEKALLDRIRAGLRIPEETVRLADRIFGEARAAVAPSDILPISDPARRSAAVRESVKESSFRSAVLGAFPAPGAAIATDLAVIGVQIGMVRDVGQYHGHTVDVAAARSLLWALGLGTGAHVAVGNVCRLVPDCGGPVGAESSFGATWALGLIADRYFEGGCRGDPARLRADFRRAEAEGREAYRQHGKAIEERQKACREKIEALHADLLAGRITQGEYEKAAAERA